MRSILAICMVSVLGFGCGSDNEPEANNNSNNTTGNNGNNSNANNTTANNGNNTNANNTTANNGNTTNSNNASNNGECVPTQSNWEATIAPLLDRSCGECHGAEPDFGAPFSINDYDEIIAGNVGDRIADRIVARVGQYTMPPPNAATMPHNDRDTLVEWASCGESHPNHAAQLVANREEHVAPDTPPAGATEVEFLAPEFAVGENTLDLYYCFSFTAPNTETMYISRIEPVVDESRVVHHTVLFDGAIDGGCSTAFGKYFYAWAPGGGAIQFPGEGGVKIEPGQQFTVQIHYNNGAAIPDVKDSSGVRLFLTESVETEYELIELGSGLPAISVAPGETVADSRTCTVSANGRFFAGFPHMHEIGSEFHETITRADNSTESIIDLTGWAFDAQLYYQYDLDVFAGDRIRTECVFENWTDSPVSGGLATSDEMCFDFVYVTPPNVNCF